MGVQGLRSQLERHYRSEVVTLHTKRGGGGKTLLVDGSALEVALLQRLVGREGDYTQGQEWHQAFYLLVCQYLQNLSRIGLSVVVVVDGPPLPGSAPQSLLERQTRTLRGAKVLPGPDVTAMIFQQALLDLEVKTLRSLYASDSLLLAYYYKHEGSIFALMTSDSDFLVYGVEKLAFLGDTTVEANSATFHLWKSSAAWLTWRSNRMSVGIAGVSITHRAQIAVLLGPEVSAGSGGRAKCRSLSTGTSLASPLTAAEVVIARHHDDPFNLQFFQEELGMKKFGESDLEAMNVAVAQYVDASMPNEPLQELLLSPERVPWLEAGVASRLAGEATVNFPPMLAGLLLTGVTDYPVLPKHQPLFNGIRRQLVGSPPFSGGPPPTFMHDPFSSSLVPLGGDTAPNQPWFQAPGDTWEMVEADDAVDAFKVKSTILETRDELKKMQPGAPLCLATLHALMLHAVDQNADYSSESVREALLPGVALPADNAIEPETQEQVAARLAAVAAEAGLEVDTGCSLSSHDWQDIDAKDLVARAKVTTSFKIMREIQPWASLDERASLQHDSLFKWMYVQRKDDMYKKLAKSCYPTEYEAIRDDKEAAKELKVLTKEEIVEGLTRDKEKHTLIFIQALERRNTMDILFLRREALQAGPASMESAAARVIWSQLGDRAKADCFEVMHTSVNKTGKSGPPRRFKHQEEIMRDVDVHLTNVENQPEKTLPLQTILATPTGSGKTFTAVMMHLHLLKDKHPDAILLYSVPTKQVLKRVGQECEAHSVVYWTAAREGDKYQVRRPYSIRHSASRNQQRRLQQNILNMSEEKRDFMEQVRKGGKCGPVEEQMAFAHKAGLELNDRGHGKPDVIIGDVYTTAAILQASHENKGDFWSPDKLVLYFDEPNMGINLDPAVSQVVHRIMLHSPLTTILASATMPAWDQLPAWWKGGARPATRTCIALQPYDLPICRFQLLDCDSREVTHVSLFHLFNSHAEYMRVMQQEGMRRIVMLRHLTPQQANQVLAVHRSAGSNSASGADAAEVKESRDWLGLFGDVRTLRENLEPALLSLTPDQFEYLKSLWGTKKESLSSTKGQGLAAAVSTTGVTMIATLDARKTALEIARCMHGGADVHEMKRRQRDAARNAKAADKEKSQKKDADDFMDGGQGDQPTAGMLELRAGLTVSLEDAAECDDSTLMMLAKGVAYTLATGTEPLVKKLYMQALLHVPEAVSGKVRGLPPIHVLVVDYSSVYGTDCPAVDTIVLDDTLGKALSWEDHQQFLGRLRRDGLAVYTSRQTLREATLGREIAGKADLTAEEKTLRAVRLLVLDQLAQCAPTPAPPAADVQEAFQALDLPEGQKGGDVARAVFQVLTELTFPLAPETAPLVPDQAKALYQENLPGVEEEMPGLVRSLRLRLRAFKGPLQGMKPPKEQLKALRSFESFCTKQQLFEGPSAASSRYVTTLLQALYEDEILEEPAIMAWADEKEVESQNTKCWSKFATAGVPFIAWLKEAEEDSDEEEEDDEE